MFNIDVFKETEIGTDNTSPVSKLIEPKTASSPFMKPMNSSTFKFNQFEVMKKSEFFVTKKFKNIQNKIRVPENFNVKIIVLEKYLDNRQFMNDSGRKKPKKIKTKKLMKKILSNQNNILIKDIKKNLSSKNKDYKFYGIDNNSFHNTLTTRKRK